MAQHRFLLPPQNGWFSVVSFSDVCVHHIAHGLWCCKVAPYIWEHLGLFFIFETKFWLVCLISRNALYYSTEMTVHKALTVNLTSKTATQFFTWHSLPHDDAPPYQLRIQKVEWFRQYLQDKAGHMDMTIPVDPTNLVHTVYLRSKMFSQSYHYSKAQPEQAEAKCWSA